VKLVLFGSNTPCSEATYMYYRGGAAREYRLFVRAEILISKLGVRGLVIKPRAARGMALIKNFRAARESLL
jgi:hypothetical protein